MKHQDFRYRQFLPTIILQCMRWYLRYPLSYRNLEDFKNQAIADLKAGKALVGKAGILTPLIKEFLEATLEGEMNSHMALP